MYIQPYWFKQTKWDSKSNVKIWYVKLQFYRNKVYIYQEGEELEVDLTATEDAPVWCPV